ncbi:MAG: hypothetical protein CL678_06670 [Bdellovibrionaceae bacterium]|nr:hypothetical protein [Pseudobdellovibrionaceae bacterium]|tara:strand:+ start:555 stop:1211 length:657 start_codon:yes stop_codon:yes gene_type:complete
MGFQDKMVSFKRRGRLRTKIHSKEAQALKAIRIARGITREQVAPVLERGRQAVERYENGRADLDEQQVKKLLRRYRITHEEFKAIIDGKQQLPIRHARSVYKTTRRDPKEYRRYQKEITKEARVLKVMRTMRGLTKEQTAKLCGFHPSCIDHRENGRTNLKKEHIRKIVHALSFTMEDFYEMVEAPILRTEVIEECKAILERIETSKLNAVRALLVNF